MFFWDKNNLIKLIATLLHSESKKLMESIKIILFWTCHLDIYIYILCLGCQFPTVGIQSCPYLMLQYKQPYMNKKLK